jgi:hypothetical protein
MSAPIYPNPHNRTHEQWGADLADLALERLEEIGPEMQRLAAQFALLAGRADMHGMTKPSAMLRHYDRELKLILDQARHVVGAVRAKEQSTGKETHE